MSSYHSRSPQLGTSLTILSVAIAAALATGYAHAQVASDTSGQGADQKQTSKGKDAEAKKDEPADPNVVVVTGSRGRFYRALNLKKTDDLIVEVISADNLGVMPNVSVAESLVRLPGVNGARDRGNESLVTVRGLGQRLTLGLVNGREIASSEPGRNVRWEIFPTEVVSTAKVYKSQSADMVAGGIGATIDIGTVSPLEHTGKSVTLTGGPVYYTEGKGAPDYNPLGGRFGASWVKRFDQNLAVALGVTYQKQKNASEALGSEGYNIDHADDVRGGTKPTPSPWGGSDEFNRGTEERKGALATVEWRSGNFKIKADALYSKIGIDSQQSQTKFNDWFVGWGANPYSTPGSSYILSDGDIVGGTMKHSNKEVDYTFGHWVEDKALNAYGINLKWSANQWTLDSDLSTSRAWRDGTWRGITFKGTADTVSYNFLNKPTISTSPISFPTDSAGHVRMEATDWGPDTVRDRVDGITFNATRQIDDSPITSIAFGVRAANREKQHGHYEWKQAVINQSMSAYTGLIREFSMPTLNVPTMMAGNLEDISRIAVGSWNPSLATQDPLATWRVEEKVREAYTKANYESRLFGVNVTGNFGVRVVQVNTLSKGSDGVGGGWYDSGGGVWLQHPFVYSPSSWEKSYTDVLPSATINFMLDHDHILRLATAKVVSRPPLDELRTGRTLDMPSPNSSNYQLNGSGGNPDLDPFRAKQLDVSYEWYFHKEALAAITVYRKWVKSVIGYKQSHQTLGGHDYLMTAPANGDGGNINGAELTFKTPLYFIPHMENFGINTNYSFVDSNLHELVPDGNPLPLSGLAKHTAEADFWYNDGTFDVGIGYKYHSPYTNVLGWNSSQLSRLKSEASVDLYAGWRINDQVRLKLSVNNLTNTPFRAYIDNQPNRLGNKNGSGGYQYYGRRISLEATVAF